MHHKHRELDVLYLNVDDPDRFPIHVTIKYEVIAENMTDKLTGQLKVFVNKQ